MTTEDLKIDPQLDLLLERFVAAPVDRVWRAWTEPRLIEKWFTPAPWRTTDCAVDLRPGGGFSCVMRGPDGEVQPQNGCYLEIVHERRLVWTDALLPGFRPSSAPFMTGIIVMTPEGGGTRYTAIARHASEAVRDDHAKMGFHEGWGAATNQLEALAKTL